MHTNNQVEYVCRAVQVWKNSIYDYFSKFFKTLVSLINSGLQIFIQADPLMAGGYNGVGISQGKKTPTNSPMQWRHKIIVFALPGDLLMRGLAQRCPEPPMVNLITYGAPSNGIFGIPNCEEGTHNYALCELVREIVSAGAYEPWLQVRENTKPRVLRCNTS
jgi:palmitoyl-protein thioesterase